jgi:hypothetical protein
VPDAEEGEFEIEDVMLAEPASDPPSLSEMSDALRTAVPSRARLSDALARLAGPPVEPNGDLPRIRLAPPPPPAEPADIPPLTAADYLFDYVVLGLLDVLSHQPPESP